MAARRISGATFDHGAQFITTHSGEFAHEVQEWCREGVAQPWYRGRVGPGGVKGTDGHVRYRGSVSMNAVAKHLALGLDVRRATRVVGIVADGARWQVHCEHGDVLDAEALVATAPVPQALELLAAGPTERPRPTAQRCVRSPTAVPGLMVPMGEPWGCPTGDRSAARPIDWISTTAPRHLGRARHHHPRARRSAPPTGTPTRVVDVLLRSVEAHQCSTGAGRRGLGAAVALRATHGAAPATLPGRGRSAAARARGRCVR
jgi:hypothetical protein